MSDRVFRCACWLAAAAFGVFLAIPLVALFRYVSVAGLLAALGERRMWQAVGLSVITSSLCTLAAVLGGLPLAWLLTGRHGRWARLVTTVAELPLVLPPSVAGLALILAYGRYQWLGPTLTHFGIRQVALTPAAVVMAQTLVAAPIFFRAARTALASLPGQCLQASAVLGEGEAGTFVRVVLPLCRGGLLGGALLTWARAMGELGATVMFAGTLEGRTLTMSTAIFDAWQRDLREAVTLAVLLLVMAAGAMLAARQFAGDPAG